MSRNIKRVWRIVCAICDHERRVAAYEEPETCSKLCAKELRRRRMAQPHKITSAQRQQMTEETINKKGELCCETCGGALYFSSEPMTGRSIWGCEPCGYQHFTDLYVGMVA